MAEEQFDPEQWANPNPNLGTGYGPPSGGISGGGSIPPPAGIYDLVPPGGSLQDLLHGLGYHGPTDRIAGMVGGLLGGATGGALVPGVGGIVGNKLGSWGIRSLVNWLGGLGTKWPGIPNKPGQPPKQPGTVADVGGMEDVTGTPPSGSPSGGGGYSPFGGLPAGFTERRNTWGEFGAPNFYGPAGPLQGPQWTGGSIFNANDPSSGGRFTPLAGSFAGLGSGGGGNLGSLGDIMARASMSSLLKFGPLSAARWSGTMGGPGSALSQYNAFAGGKPFSYQDYLQNANTMIEALRANPSLLARPRGESTGQGPGGAGRAFTQNR